MNCNKKCYWNYRGECCPEDEQGYDNTNPNETEKCITWIRPDFDTYFWSVYDEISDLINHRNLGELEDIRTFIKNQRNNQNKENDFIIFHDVDEEWDNTIEEYYRLKLIDNPNQNEQIKIKELYNKLSEKLDSYWR